MLDNFTHHNGRGIALTAVRRGERIGADPHESKNLKPEPVGLIGLGLMGRGIATCLLSHGLEVIAYNRTAGGPERACATSRSAPGIGPPEAGRARASSATGGTVPAGRLARGIGPRAFVIESVKEDLELKREIYRQLESADGAGRGDRLQHLEPPDFGSAERAGKHPARFIGMHWGEPAQIMRYLEMIPGKQTSAETIELTLQLGRALRKGADAPAQWDIQGFISNRMMYAMMREACLPGGIGHRRYRNGGSFLP